MWNELTMKQRADVISMAVKAGMRDIDSIRSFYNKTIESGRNKFAEGGPSVTDNVPDDYTYYAGNLPAVTVSAPALPAYQDQFTGQWYGIGPGGRKVNKPANFDPSGARVYTSPEAFERARLNRAYADDLNHYGEFSDMVRKGATALTLAPMAGPLVETASAVGDAAYAGYKALPWITHQLLNRGTQSVFATQGLNNFFGPEGTKKTTKLLNEGKYRDAILSATGDVLNLSMAVPVLEAGQALGKSLRRLNQLNFVPSYNTNLKGIEYAYSRNPELANIGTIESYKEYLKTIFPKSKVRDINYHMGPKGLQELKPSTGEGWNTNPDARGIYVTPDKSYAQKIRKFTTDRLEKPSMWTFLKRNLTPGGWDKANATFTDIYPVMIDTKNPLYTKGTWTWGIKDKKYQSLMNKYDAIVNSGPKWYQNINSMPEVIIPKTEQTLILGSNADVTGFRKFISSSITPENAASVK